MRTIIAGSRNFTDHFALITAMASLPFTPTVVLCGGAAGADTLGAWWAKRRKIPVEMYLADWNKRGRVAGAVRNLEMAAKGETLVAFWDGESSGTRHMIETARKRYLRVFIFDFNGERFRYGKHGDGRVQPAEDVGEGVSDGAYNPDCAANAAYKP